MKSILEEMYDWLLVPISIEEAEARYDWGGVPFGHLNPDWQQLRLTILGDPTRQLWTFCSPEETWTTFPYRGWEGIAVIKDGEIIDILVTGIS
jgi:hypothetical protein